MLLARLLKGIEGPAVGHIRVPVIARPEPGDRALGGVLGLAVLDAGHRVEAGGVSLAHVVAHFHIHVIVPVEAAKEPGVLHRKAAGAFKIQIKAGVVGGRNTGVDIGLGVQGGVGAGGVIQKRILLRQWIVPQADLGFHLRLRLRCRLRAGFLYRLRVRTGRHLRRGHADPLHRLFFLRSSAAGGKAKHQQAKQQNQQALFHPSLPFAFSSSVIIGTFSPFVNASPLLSSFQITAAVL